MLYQALGILSSSRTNFFLYSLMTYLLSNDAWADGSMRYEDALILCSVSGDGTTTLLRSGDAGRARAGVE